MDVTCCQIGEECRLSFFSHSQTCTHNLFPVAYKNLSWWKYDRLPKNSHEVVKNSTWSQENLCKWSGVLDLFWFCCWCSSKWHKISFAAISHRNAQCLEFGHAPIPTPHPKVWWEDLAFLATLELGIQMEVSSLALHYLRPAYLRPSADVTLQSSPVCMFGSSFRASRSYYMVAPPSSLYFLPSTAPSCPHDTATVLERAYKWREQ